MQVFIYCKITLKCFGCPSHPSPTTFLQLGHLTTLEEGCCSDTMTCTRGCSYSFMYSWWWVRRTSETCRVILQ